jgi:CRP/FNR family transcriptional regulator, cyclic AMP receptor protein
VTTRKQEKGEPEWLKEALQNQILVQEDARLAAELAPVVHLRQFESGASLMTEGGNDNDLYFILQGKISVRVSGREIATLGSGQQVGELALLNCSERRTATVVAKEAVVAGKISKQNFIEVARRHPELWRRMAADLGNKLAKMTGESVN